MFKKFTFFAVLVIGGLAFVSCAVSEIDKDKKVDLFRQVELFSDTLAIIETDFVDETKPKDLIYGALNGMLSALDAHSQFLDPETYQELKVETEGKFGGLGIEITIRDGLLTVVTPIEDTPAWKVGLKAGDRIVKIDKEITRDMSIIDAVKKLRGKPGDPVHITVLRESESKILEFNIVRDMINIRNVKEARILEDGIGYIRLIEFTENAPRDFAEALQKLKKEKMEALILDLRNNPGGLLDVAVEVTQNFIEKGKIIVYTKGRKPTQNLEFIAKEKNPLLDIPLAVLINEGSASGSEIVAGCLQDYKRAIIVGMKSFGKGSVQTVFPLKDGSAIRLTTSKYFTPSGRVIHEKGVAPDIAVEQAKVDLLAKQEDEAKKPAAIFEEMEKTEEKRTEEKKADSFDYKSDNQLIRSLDILKAIRFYKHNNSESIAQ